MLRNEKHAKQTLSEIESYVNVIYMAQKTNKISLYNRDYMTYCGIPEVQNMGIVNLNNLIERSNRIGLFAIFTGLDDLVYHRIYNDKLKKRKVKYQNKEKEALSETELGLLSPVSSNKERKESQDTWQEVANQ